jgi:hypothetical protein
MSPSGIDWPFVLRRRQFPIQVAFAITINKNQGQTLNNVGIYLPSLVYSHGQLYVAISQAVQTSRFSTARVLMDTCEMLYIKRFWNCSL